MLNRLLYIAYYIKNINWPRLRSFLDYARLKSARSKTMLWGEMLSDAYFYKISLLEYFLFNFYRGISHTEKKKWAGTGYMFEYQRLMNPPDKRGILDDKTLFYQKYRPYFQHHVMTVEEMEEDRERVAELLQQPKIVLKESRGKCGLGTAFIEAKDYTVTSLVAYMKSEGFDLAETFIHQHPELNRLSPSGVNTVRIFTQLNAKNEVEILGCRQRISVNSPVDNLAAGNLAAPIDEATGIINGPGVYSDITKSPEWVHPATGTPIEGFQVPFWQECLALAKRAALEHPENRSIGWDIVVTPEGPGLIEGNHDWCKLVWQLPVNEGLKPILEKHKEAYIHR